MGPNARRTTARRPDSHSEGNLAAVRKPNEFHVDEAAARLDETLPFALAIGDALKALTALERAPSDNDGGLDHA